MDQLTIFDFLQKKKNCYIFAKIKNGEPYFGGKRHCECNGPCGSCAIEVEYQSIRRDLEKSGVSYFDAIRIATDRMEAKYSA